jgi:hypothetical protein
MLDFNTGGSTLKTQKIKIDDIASAVGRWCKRQFVLRSSYYTGRGVNQGDLNSEFLEMIYQGLKAEVGQEAATNFAKFVHNLKDLTASGFIIAFEQFWYSGCRDTNVSLSSGVSNQLSGRGDQLLGEGFALIGSVLGGGLSSPKEIERESQSVKRWFIFYHGKEIEK